MPTTTLSSDGSVTIPGSIRAAHHWAPGQTFVVESTDDGLVLRPAHETFPPIDPSDVRGVGKKYYDGPSVSVDDMNAAIRTRLRARNTNTGTSDADD